MNLRQLRYKFRLYSILHQDKTIQFQSTNPRIFVFLAADYGNLGDVAITYAQEKLLKEKYPDYEIVDVPISKTLSLIRPIKKTISPNDIITITGGGNMGEMYGDIELLRLMVIRMFPNNKIIVFPQTTDYIGENNYLFRLAHKTYNSHKDLTLLAREEVTYAKIAQCFPKAEVHLVPDVVMTLDKWENKERNGILFCLRNDKEKGKSRTMVETIIAGADKYSITTNDYDTHIDKNHMPLDVREEELQQIWSKFSSSQLIVTDRLHGMIFAYITGTPAIVFPNSNFKIEKCFNWITDCGYIFFCKDNITDIQTALNTIPNRTLFKEKNKQFIQKITASL